MRRRDHARHLGRYPAFVAAAALHLAVLAAALIVLPKPMTIGDVTTVTLMTSQDMAAPREAEPAPTPAPAQTEIPDLNAPPAQPAPRDVQTPTPLKAQPPAKAAPAPTPKPDAKIKPKQDDDNFADNLAASLGVKSHSGRPGPNQPAKGKHSNTPESGTTVSANSLVAIQAALNKVWHKNCGGGSNINVTITFKLQGGGRLVPGTMTSPEENSKDPLVIAAYTRAVLAINRAQPFKNLPLDFQGGMVPAQFNAKEACSQQ